MRRREFLRLFGGAAMLWPHSARAQQAVPIIGILHAGSPETSARRVEPFFEGLRENGYIEGASVAIERRWAEGRIDRFPALAADLARRNVAVIASLSGVPAARAAMAATTTIPIVFQGGFDPVEFGIVGSLNRPSGNITGVTNLNVELGPKRLELTHELLPGAKVIGLLLNPHHPTVERQLGEMQKAADALGVRIRVVHASGEHDFEPAFAEIAKTPGAPLVIGIGAPFANHLEALGALAGRQGVPAISQTRAFAEAGGLMSYGGYEPDAFRLVGVYTGRILKGERAAELPIQQATKLELIINLQTAKRFGISVPQSFLVRADEVIE